ncbi:FMN-dependent NADH-azoreductase [Actinokineospora soli]|uniref:FMN dependent NADH:quinone oxidoreductase n=1 Tax=Actinokineospora soli TaxID=1048753 RepID=A0ABW2TMV7_9PSEU
MRVLHVIASPRGAKSNTLRVAQAFLDGLGDGVEVETLDLFEEDLPAVAGENIEAKYKIMLGMPIDREHGESWGQVERLIAQFLAADLYVLSAPMWNFHIPYALKYYIDAIVQPGYLFGYTETGTPIGLVQGKRMVVVSTRGGDYSEGGPMAALDLQTPYLRAIFGFVGITDIDFLHAQPMDLGPEPREAAIAAATGAARELAAGLTAVRAG